MSSKDSVRPQQRRAGLVATVTTTTIIIAAALGLGGCAVGLGYQVNPAQEPLVTPGMTEAEVLAVAGRPARNVKYRNQVGPTFTYKVRGTTLPPMLFDIDFGADGKVASTSERMDMDYGGGDGRHGGGGGGHR